MTPPWRTCWRRRRRISCAIWNQDALPRHTDSLLVELAALNYLSSRHSAGSQEESYAEGQLSQSQRYYSPPRV